MLNSNWLFDKSEYFNYIISQLYMQNSVIQFRNRGQDRDWLIISRVRPVTSFVDRTDPSNLKFIRKIPESIDLLINLQVSTGVSLLLSEL